MMFYAYTSRTNWRIVPFGYTPKAGEFVFDHTPTEAELADAFPPPNYTLTEHLKSIRWDSETAGLMWGDVLVPTDLETQTRFDQESRAVTEGLRKEPKVWCFPDRPRMLTNRQVLDIWAVIRAHRQKTFDAYAEVLPLVEDGTLKTASAVESEFTARMAA